MLLSGWIDRLRNRLGRQQKSRIRGGNHGGKLRVAELFEPRTMLTAPTLSGLGLVNDTGTPGDGITSDARVGGVLNDSDYSGVYYLVEVDTNGDGSPDDSIYSYPGGSFEYDVNNSGTLSNGSVSASFRGVENGYAGQLYGSWQSVAFEYQEEGSSGGGGPDVSVSQSTTQITEGSSVVFSLQENGASGFGAEVEYEILPGPADSTEYYDVDKDIGSVSLDYSTGSGTLTITAVDDNIDEFNENFTVHLIAHNSYGSTDLGTFDVEILDNDAAPDLSLQRVDIWGSDQDISGNALTNTVPEDEGVARFNVMFSHPSEKDVTLQFGTVIGTATGIGGTQFDYTKDDEDFELVSNRNVSLSSYEYYYSQRDFVGGTLEVPLNDDWWHEGLENFSINMTATNATLASTSVVVTINDDLDDRPIVFVPETLSVIEDVVTQTVDIPVQLSNPSLFPVSLDYTTLLSDLNPDATDVEDYLSASGIVSFPAADPATFTTADLEKLVSIAIVNDALWDNPTPTNQPWAPSEYFGFNISNPVNADLEKLYYGYGFGYGYGNDTTDVEIIDEQSFPNLTVGVPPNSIDEGGTVDLTFSFDQVFETTEVLNYQVYWDFDDHQHWAWHGGDPGDGHPNGQCGPDWGPPEENGAFLVSGSITLTPDGQHDFTNITIPAPPANGLRDPSRFVRIVFDWENEDYEFYYNPTDHILPIVDDRTDPDITSFTIQPDPIFEDPNSGPNSAVGLLTLEHAWSVPQEIYLNVDATGQADQFDVEMPDSVFLVPGQTALDFRITAVHDDPQNFPEGDELAVIQATPFWFGNSATAEVTIIDSLTATAVTFAVSPQNATFEVPSDLIAGSVFAGFEVENESLAPLSINGPFSRSGNTLVYDGSAPLVSGDSYVITWNNANTPGTAASWTVTVVDGGQSGGLIGQSAFEIVEGAGAAATVGYVAARNDNGRAVSFAIDDPTGTLPFEIDSETGLLSTTSAFDATAGSNYSIDLSVGTITVNVIAEDRSRNLPAIAMPDFASSSGSTIFIDVTQNDFDPEGGSLSQLQILDSPVAGSATVVTQNNVTGISYDFGQSQTHLDTFTYTITDDFGNVSIGIVNVGDASLIDGQILVELNAGNVYETQPYMVAGSNGFGVFRDYRGGIRDGLNHLTAQGYDWQTTSETSAQSTSFDVIINVGAAIVAGENSGGSSGTLIQSAQLGSQPSSVFTTTSPWNTYSTWRRAAYSTADSSGHPALQGPIVFGGGAVSVGRSVTIDPPSAISDYPLIFRVVSSGVGNPLPYEIAVSGSDTPEQVAEKAANTINAYFGEMVASVRGDEVWLAVDYSSEGSIYSVNVYEHGAVEGGTPLLFGYTMTACDTVGTYAVAAADGDLGAGSVLVSSRKSSATRLWRKAKVLNF